MKKLNSKKLRASSPSKKELVKIKRHDIYIIIDNILDTFNIGSIFRLADAMAVKKILICGKSETPPNHRITKASVNTWQWVEWEYFEHVADAINKLKKINPKIQIIAIEQTQQSVDYKKVKYQHKYYIG